LPLIKLMGTLVEDFDVNGWNFDIESERSHTMGFGRSWGYYDNWAPYVTVAQRRAEAAANAKQLEKERGRPLAPIKIEGRKIAKSFWGKAWCDNLEAYSDYANRLPRGRTYVRNGSVIDLEIAKGKIVALVSGSEVYTLTITISALPRENWQTIQRSCARSITSLIDLLQGRFDRGIMERLTQKDGGLFPKPKEIKLSCSCPDSAGMCKHVAAVMYGVGAKLDQSPELLFTLRNVDHLELISQAVSDDNLNRALTGDLGDSLQADDLGQIFGIELETGRPATADDVPTRKPRRKPSPPAKAVRTATKKPAKRNATAKGSQSSPKPTASAKPVKAKTATVTRTSKIQTKKKPAAAVVVKPARRIRPAK
jgi:uncharacterized Zn finger protein